MNRSTIAVAIASLLAGACSLLSRPSEDEWDGPIYPHLVHVQEEDLGCTDCHRDVEREAMAGMPGLRGCMLCHEDIDDELPAERRVSAFLVGEQLNFRDVTALGGDLQFSHRVHVAKEIECKTCHGDVGATKTLQVDALRVQKDDCLECHAESKVGTECTACHEVIRPDRRPETHTASWTERHGEIVFSGRTDQPRHRCEQCHDQSACDNCHLQEPPANHSSLWRRAGHGTAAAFDRERCTTCHRADSCESCHAIARPRSHAVGFGEPAFMHCVDGCHVGPSGAGCTTCHRSLQAHGDAPPLAGRWGQPPHPVPNGQRCTACHEL
jgi:hypothetical protein